MRKWILSLTIIFIFASCTKKSTPTPTPTPIPEPPVVVNPPTPYSVTEDFELNSKITYAINDITLKTGTWSFDDAVTGDSADDAKNGIQSVRLKSGRISMLYDVDSLKTLKFSHAQFGSDGPSEFTVWASTDQGRTYNQIKSFTNNSTSLVIDSVKFDTYQKIRFQIRKTGSIRMNIDDFTFIGAGDNHLEFNANADNPPDNGGTTGGGSGGTPSGSGNDVPPSNGDNSNLLMGNPSNATAEITNNNNYLIDLKYYTESYSSSRAIPNWVSWHLDPTSLGSTGRQDNFAAFTDLPSSYYQVQSYSFSGSGFDRGHNCPSADRTSSVEANSSTFLMINMIPQAPLNNQQTWGNLENYLRTFVKSKGDEVYIIMGSYGKGGTGSSGFKETIDNGHVTIPARVWKVAVIISKGDNDLSRIDENTKVIAVDTPNDNSINSDWTKYITTVDAIEQATGYNLLSSLPTSVQNVIEAKKFVP